MDASGSGSNSKRCDRCRKADAECNYAASRPVGRPKAAHGRRSSRSPKSPPPPPASRRASTATTTTTTETQQQPQPQPQLYLDDDYFNTLLLAAETPAMTETDAAMLDAHGFDLFYHDPVPSPGDHHHHYHQSDSTSASVAADHQQHRPDPLLTPPSSSSRSFPPFATASSTPSHTSSISSSTSSSSVLTRPHTTAPTLAIDRRRAMQHLSDLGLRLYTQLAAHQDSNSSSPDVGTLAGDVLRSSNDYLATISLFSSQHQHQDRGQHGHLDMATAFQLLIPYVRLVQLHDVLLEAMLRALSSSAPTTPETTTMSRRCESSGFPDVWVGGVCVVAADSNGQGGGQGGVFAARLLLQMCLCVLGEIESVLGLPGEARIVEGGDWGPVGGGAGGAGGDEVDGGALLPQAVSPRLLRTVLDERYGGGGGGAPSGGVDVRATRDRIAGVRRLLRR
ncbi:hypothetical protein SLS54_010376 [Diplodia seriata]